MRILALADRKITVNLAQLIKDEYIEIVFLLGDLKFNEICDLQGIEIPIVGVLGNHCSFDYLKTLEAFNLHGNSQNILGTNFGGYQGCPFYKGGQFESTQDQCSKILRSLPAVDIFLSHSPATGINSTDSSPHEGFQGILEYIERESPSFFFHGHSYPPESQKISLYKNTIVYFVEGLEIIDLDSLKNLKNLPESKTY